MLHACKFKCLTTTSVHTHEGTEFPLELPKLPTCECLGGLHCLNVSFRKNALVLGVLWLMYLMCPVLLERGSEGIKVCNILLSGVLVIKPEVLNGNYLNP